MKRIKNNGLSIAFILLFVISFIGQIGTGLKEYNANQLELGGKEVNVVPYLKTGHFIEATFENWESEFLQMALFIVLSIFLYQKGSSESKNPDEEEEVDEQPDAAKKNAPLLLKKGGIIAQLYKNSLSIAFFSLFFVSFVLHWWGSLKAFNEEQALKSLPTETFFQYLGNSKLWFESFQNWQSEFFSVFALIAMSIYLRQQGSAQSKPVAMGHQEME